jgi:hypothetical protein
VFEGRAKDFMPLDNGPQSFSKDFRANVSRNRNQTLGTISWTSLLRSPELLLPWREAKSFNYVVVHISTVRVQKTASWTKLVGGHPGVSGNYAWSLPAGAGWLSIYIYRLVL